jgi:hypothetical protein
MLKDEDFSNTAKVDRYGRKLSSEGKKKALQRLYVPEEEAEDAEVEEDDVVEEELQKADAGLGDARYRGFSSSSEDESEDELEDDEDEDGGVAIEEEFPDMQAERAGVEMGEVTNRFAVGYFLLTVLDLSDDNRSSISIGTTFVQLISWLCSRALQRVARFTKFRFIKVNLARSVWTAKS